MVQIDIHIPRPLLTLGITAAVMWVLVSPQGASILANATGGSDVPDAVIVHEAEEDMQRLRDEQAVLDRREEILRADLAGLEEQLIRTQDQTVAAELVQARAELIELLQDQRAAEQEILLSLHQIWDAQGIAIAASGRSDGTMPVFVWPVEPTLGISAYFHDAAYEKRFGMTHQAIDIPVDQGSPVAAAADGIVSTITDNGLGYSSIVIQHDGGHATLYGHVSKFLVKEGQEVRAGQYIALSGGTPGTQGSGRMTTGAHLHFEMIRSGAHVDPLTVLR